MEGSHHGAIPCKLPDLRQVFNHILLLNVGADFLSKEFRHLLHLVGHGGIVGAQICMSLSCIYNNQAVILGTEIEIDLLNDRSFRVLKINRDQAAYRAGHLVQKAGCLVPELVLGVFSNVRIVHHIHFSIVEKCIDHGAD